MNRPVKKRNNENEARENRFYGNYDRQDSSRMNSLPCTSFERRISYVPQPIPTLNLPTSMWPSNSESVLQHFWRKTSTNRSQMRRSSSSHQNTVYDELKRWYSLRNWQLTKLGKQRKDRKQGIVFTLMSYNVLAQDLINEHLYLYKYHIPAALSWDVRWRNILYEIKFHHSDIICFQEVQKSHLDDFYNKELSQLGYSYLFKQRTGGVKSDGCAIYFKHDLFNLLEHHTVEYNQGTFRILDRDNVAIIAKFEPKQYPGNEFIVSTTHLLYNPRREDIRIAQTQLLLSELDRFSFKKGSKEDHLPVILTGDFNTQPNSACYNLLNHGWLELDKNNPFNIQGENTLVPSCLGITDTCQHLALIEERENKDLSRDEELNLISLQHSEKANTPSPVPKTSLIGTGTLSHSLNLKSVYLHKNQFGAEATTHQDQWITVDYIFYSAVRNGSNALSDGRLKLLSRFTLPTAEHLRNVRIPNMIVGSDHFSVLAKFKLECN